MNMEFSVNWLLLGAGTIIGMGTGMLWYSPLLFSNLWLKTLGINLEDITESHIPPWAAYLTSIFAHILLSFIIGVLILNLKIQGFHFGMVLGLICWMGFNFTSVIKYVFFETRPFKLFLINAGYDIVCFTLIGGVFAQWQ